MANKKPTLHVPKAKYGKPLNCKGGPWDMQVVMFPTQPADDPLSLPIRVGEHVGRYNLNTGHWVPSEQQA